MPLYHDGLKRIRENLEALAKGERVQPTAVGYLSAAQLKGFNAERAKLVPPLFPLQNPELIFFGAHIYKSRIAQDGYTIDDVMKQIASGLADTAVVKATSYLSAFKSTVLRADGYGNEVLDEIILELVRVKPKAELFSVVPKGDRRKPPQAF